MDRAGVSEDVSFAQNSIKGGNEIHECFVVMEAEGGRSDGEMPGEFTKPQSVAGVG